MDAGVGQSHDQGLRERKLPHDHAKEVVQDLNGRAKEKKTFGRTQDGIGRALHESSPYSSLLELTDALLHSVHCPADP